MSLIPEGFDTAPSRGPFTDINGPVYWRPGGENAPPCFGFLPEDRHCNSLGFVHGGMVTAVLDSAMAQGLFSQHGHRLVTLSLTVEFRSPTPKGRWVDVHVDLREPDGDTVEAHATLKRGPRICAHAKGTYKLLPRST